MYQYTLFSIFLLGLVLTSHAYHPTWTVIGAGPAGIVTVSTLIDNGTPADHIHWVDPSFTVGRLGAYYNNVPANSCVADFIEFLTGSATCIQHGYEAIAQLNTYDHASYQPLRVVTEPLQHITNNVRTVVHSHIGTAHTLDCVNGTWYTTCDTGETIASNYVVLATGARPRVLDYQVNDVIPLDAALNKDSLAQYVTSDDTVCVVGSAHSAILLLKYLTELSVRHIINLYRRPLIYAYHDGTNSIHPASGLKGIAAQWAYHVLEHNPPDNLTRVYNDEDNRDVYLPECTKIIYAVGYERNPLPTFSGTEFATYDGRTGVIAPGLFGIGIAFPEQGTDSLGNREYLVGVNSFLSYAQRVVPYWMTNPEPTEHNKECNFSLIIDTW